MALCKLNLHTLPLNQITGQAHHLIFSCQYLTANWTGWNVIVLRNGLTLIPDHQLDSENLNYHKEHIYTND